MKTDTILIRNAHTHNLKQVDLELPKHRMVVFTGVSGSGKSSLLFDTIYTEAQRQLVETFSSFARARLPKLSRPDVNDGWTHSPPLQVLSLVAQRSGVDNTLVSKSKAVLMSDSE